MMLCGRRAFRGILCCLFFLIHPCPDSEDDDEDDEDAHEDSDNDKDDLEPA